MPLLPSSTDASATLTAGLLAPPLDEDVDDEDGDDDEVDDDEVDDEDVELLELDDEPELPLPLDEVELLELDDEPEPTSTASAAGSQHEPQHNNARQRRSLLDYATAHALPRLFFVSRPRQTFP